MFICKEFSEYGEYDDAELVSAMETTEDPEMILDKTELEARRMAQRKILARQRYKNNSLLIISVFHETGVILNN